MISPTTTISLDFLTAKVTTEVLHFAPFKIFRLSKTQACSSRLYNNWSLVIFPELEFRIERRSRYRLKNIWNRKSTKCTKMYCIEIKIKKLTLIISLWRSKITKIEIIASKLPLPGGKNLFYYTWRYHTPNECSKVPYYSPSLLLVKIFPFHFSIISRYEVLGEINFSINQLKILYR